MELDVISRRYGKLPSEICNREISDYNLDILVAVTALKEEQKLSEKAQRGNKVAYRRK